MDANFRIAKFANFRAMKIKGFTVDGIPKLTDCLNTFILFTPKFMIKSHLKPAE
jgi:hypothetical protein